MQSADTPTTARGSYNEADLRYLREALVALGDVHGASDEAAAGASDPRVRALARRAGATQADDIRTITSMLLGWGHETGPALVGLPATAADLRSLDGLEVDRRFIEILTAHAEASLVSARIEMLEGFGGSSRRHAESASRANWRELAALDFLEATPE
jgi:uncharacterized protein (DUF305 family)